VFFFCIFCIDWALEVLSGVFFEKLVITT